MCDALAPAQPRDEVYLLIHSVGRKEHCDRLAYRLIDGIAKEAFRTRIPALNDAIKIFCDNRIVGSLDDGS